MASMNRSTGTGTAPFRSFWQELDEVKSTNDAFIVPKVWLFFGCRAKGLDLYSDEKREMLEKGILDKVFLALSREVNTPKVSRDCAGVNIAITLLSSSLDLRPESDNERSGGNLQFN